MLIGIDISRIINKEKTGVEWYAYFLIREFIVHSAELIGDEHEVVLYVHKEIDGEFGELPPNWSVKVLRWPPKRLWTQIRLSFEMFMHPPNVLFIPAHVAPLIHPKKTVVTIHDIAATKFPETYNWFERWYSVWSARYALKKLWKVIVPSEFTKEELLKLETGNKELGDVIHVVYHGYTPNKYDADIRHILDKYVIAKPYIISIGRLEEKKNTWRIVEAFTQIRNSLQSSVFNLVLVGKPGEGYKKVQGAIDASPYKDDIIVTGWIAEEEKYALLQQAEVFLFPSLYEGFGLPLLEAFDAGVPVIASQGTSLEEVGRGACVFVDSRDIEDIVDKTIDVLRNVDTRTELIVAGKKRLEHFSWEKCARETMSILIASNDRTIK